MYITAVQIDVSNLTVTCPACVTKSNMLVVPGQALRNIDYSDLTRQNRYIRYSTKEVMFSPEALRLSL